MRATWKGGMVMRNKKYLQSAAEYQLTMITAFKLHKLNILTDEDLALIEAKTAEKYCIKDNSIYRQHNLL